MDLAPVETETRAELAPVRTMRELVPSIEVRSHTDFEWCSGVLRQVKAEAKRIEDRRTEITKPLNAALRSVNDLFRPVKAAWEEIERALKGKLEAYAAQIEAERIAAMVAAAALPSSDMVLAPPTAAGVSMRKVRKWRYGPQGEDGVPRDWCSPDPVKIQSYLDAGGRVPGVELYEETITSVRA